MKLLIASALVCAFFWFRSETEKKKKKMVESQWYQRHYVGAASDPREGSEGQPKEERRDYF